MTQTDRLHELLKDLQWHETPEIQEKVYGAAHLGLCRIAARAHELRKRLPPGWRIEGQRIPERPSVYKYRLIPPVEGQQRLFKAS